MEKRDIGRTLLGPGPGAMPAFGHGAGPHLGTGPAAIGHGDGLYWGLALDHI